jgi:hypothetical protein
MFIEHKVSSPKDCRVAFLSAIAEKRRWIIHHLVETRHALSLQVFEGMHILSFSSKIKCLVSTGMEGMSVSCGHLAHGLSV